MFLSYSLQSSYALELSENKSSQFSMSAGPFLVLGERVFTVAA